MVVSACGRPSTGAYTKGGARRGRGRRPPGHRCRGAAPADGAGPRSPRGVIPSFGKIRSSSRRRPHIARRLRPRDQPIHRAPVDPQPRRDLPLRHAIRGQRPYLRPLRRAAHLLALHPIGDVVHDREKPTRTPPPATPDSGTFRLPEAVHYWTPGITSRGRGGSTACRPRCAEKVGPGAPTGEADRQGWPASRSLSPSGRLLKSSCLLFDRCTV